MAEEVAISVKDVYKNFKLPHEKHSGLKQAVINFKPGRHYETQEVLKGVSFEVKKGEFFGIVGRNGSGKSTLLKLLAQIYTPNKGSVIIDGSLTPFIELGVGFNPELTGRQNVYLNGALLGFDHKQMDELYDGIVDFAELHEFMDQKLKNYSSGMQVRLAFSVAIRAKSDILLIDEVLAVGDAAFQQKCFSYFEEIKSTNRTLILVTHDMSAVKRFCNRALILEKGMVKEVGTPSDVADIYIADNIAADSAVHVGKVHAEKSKVVPEIIKQEKGKLLLRVKYESKEKDEVYLGLSIMQNGISFAEITTPSDAGLVGDGIVNYELDITNFNAGAYHIDAALFRLKNRELLGVTRKKPQFIIKGHDITRGAALKLADTWEYIK